MQADWTPVVMAIAVSIPTLSAALATLLVSLANRGDIREVKAVTNGQNARLANQVADLTAQVQALHAVAVTKERRNTP